MSRLSLVSLCLSVAGLVAVAWVAVLARALRADIIRVSQTIARQESPAADRKPELPADLAAEIKRLRTQVADLHKALTAAGSSSSGEALTVSDVKRVIEDFQAQQARAARVKEWEARKPELGKTADKWVIRARTSLNLDEAQSKEIAAIRQEQVDRYVKLMIDPNFEMIEDPVTHQHESHFLDDLKALEDEMENRVKAVFRPEQLKQYESVPRFLLH